MTYRPLPSTPAYQRSPWLDYWKARYDEWAAKTFKRVRRFCVKVIFFVSIAVMFLLWVGLSLLEVYHRGDPGLITYAGALFFGLPVVILGDPDAKVTIDWDN